MRMRMLLAAWMLTTSPALAQAPARDVPLELRVTQHYRLGGVDAPEWAALTDVRSIGFGPGGELWVADGRGGRVVRVAADGRSARSVTRRGRGPGEVQVPTLVVPAGNGNVLVADALNALQVLSPEGGIIGYSADGFLAQVKPIAWVSGNRFAGTPEVMILDGQPRLATDYAAALTTLPLVTFAVDTAPRRRTIVSMAYPQRPPRADPMTPHVFSAVPQWAAHNGRIAVAEGPAYSVRILDEAGRETGRISRPLEPRTPTRADLEAARAEARSRMVTPEGEPRMIRAGMGGRTSGENRRDLLRRIERALDDMTHADRVPLIQDMKFDADGRLWIARTPDVWGRPPLLDVFSPTGAYLGTTQALPRMPDAFGPGGLVGFLEKDDLDVPVLDVRRVVLRT